MLAPIALYPDALVAQILMCSTNVTKVRDLQAFIQKNKNLKGTALQEAAGKQGFDPSYVALTLFPQVVKTMNDSVGWTRQMGQAFTADKKAVFESIQRLRTLALDVGNLKTTPQQEVQKVDQGGQQVIVIQPANPQVVYVPQYNPQTVYTTPAPVTQTIVIHEDDDDERGSCRRHDRIWSRSGHGSGHEQQLLPWAVWLWRLWHVLRRILWLRL